MDISRQEAVCLCEVESPVKAPMPRDSGPLSRSDSLRTFPFFNCLKCRSNRVGSTPLKPRCRIYFDPGFFYWPNKAQPGSPRAEPLPSLFRFPVSPNTLLVHWLALNSLATLGRLDG
jgi:hypothetical protein